MQKASGKESLVPIMTGQYEQISAIEARWGIRFKEGDMRPRIDYFHDAVRALLSGEADVYSANSRLSVEHLAYDMSQLRQIQAKPTGVGIIDTKHTQDVVKYGQQGAVAGGPPRNVRQDMAQLYKDYTVLFAALFAEIADMNFQSRNDDMDTAVEDIALIEQIMEQLANGQLTKEEALQSLDHIENDQLRAQVAQVIKHTDVKHREQEMVAEKLQAVEQQIATEQKRINDAHLHYTTAQLAVYEDSKDVVKKLAAQGMNIAGKFVENAVQQAGKGQGRGF